MSYFKNKVKTGHLSFTEGGLKNFICSTSGATEEDKKMLLDEYKRLIIENHVADKVRVGLKSFITEEPIKWNRKVKRDLKSLLTDEVIKLTDKPIWFTNHSKPIQTNKHYNRGNNE